MENVALVVARTLSPVCFLKGNNNSGRMKVKMCPLALGGEAWASRQADACARVEKEWHSSFAESTSHFLKYLTVRNMAPPIRRGLRALSSKRRHTFLFLVLYKDHPGVLSSSGE